MVESSAAQGDGLNRPVMYAKWREDKEADAGYSKELVNVETPVEVLDNMDSHPKYQQSYDNILQCFLNTVEKKRDDPFMGTRQRKADGSFGDYAW